MWLKRELCKNKHNENLCCLKRRIRQKETENYLVFKNGIIMPAAVATSSSTTCNMVSTTFISFTTRALALELSMPSTVTYCCCDKCSILEICVRNLSQMGRFQLMTCLQLTRVWQFSNTSLTSCRRSSLWYCTFSSISAMACLRFSISFCNQTIKRRKNALKWTHSKAGWRHAFLSNENVVRTRFFFL